MNGEAESEKRRGEVLLGLARWAIESELGRNQKRALASEGDWLEEPAATFITLHRNGQLRGCIGSLSPRKSLREDVVSNARAAAFEDPRFSALTVAELGGVIIEVSVLTLAEPIECKSEDELLTSLRPGLDGLVLECGPHRSTFLPQVWENCGESRQFVEALKRKAGLASDFWSDEIRFSRYTVEKYSEG